MAQQVLTQFEEHPDAWTRVPDIMERSTFTQSKVTNLLPVSPMMADARAVHRPADLRETHHNAVEDAP